MHTQTKKHIRTKLLKQKMSLVLLILQNKTVLLNGAIGQWWKLCGLCYILFLLFLLVSGCIVSILSTTIHVWNRTVTTQLVNITPYDKVISSKPDVSYFRTFGSTAYQHVPKSLRNKLAAKSEKVVFVGYKGMGKSYRLWHPGTKKFL